MKAGIKFGELFPEGARCPKCNGIIVKVKKRKSKEKFLKRFTGCMMNFMFALIVAQIYWLEDNGKRCLRWIGSSKLTNPRNWISNWGFQESSPSNTGF